VGSLFHSIRPSEAKRAWAAVQFDRPVQWVATRSENSLEDSHGPDHVTTAALAFDDDELNRYTVG